MTGLLLSLGYGWIVTLLVNIVQQLRAELSVHTGKLNSLGIVKTDPRQWFRAEKCSSAGIFLVICFTHIWCIKNKSVFFYLLDDPNQQNADRVS